MKIFFDLLSYIKELFFVNRHSDNLADEHKAVATQRLTDTDYIVKKYEEIANMFKNEANELKKEIRELTHRIGVLENLLHISEAEHKIKDAEMRRFQERLAELENKR